MAAAADPFVFCVCNKHVPIRMHAYNEFLQCVHTARHNAEWVMVLPPRTCNVQMGELKQDKQSTVHINLITADGLWDMDWEYSIYIEKHGEVKGTPKMV